MGWMDALASREGVRVERGVYLLDLDDAGNVRGTASVSGVAAPERDGVVFALSPGVGEVRVEIDGAGAPAEAVGGGLWSVARPLAAGGRHHVRVQYAGRLDAAFMRDTSGHAWYEMQFMTRWRPLFGLDRAESSRVALTLPATFGAASTFALIGCARTGDAVRYVWDTGDTTSTDFALAVGQGLHADGRQGSTALRALCQRASACSPEALLAAGADCVRSYAAAWGPCPFSRLTLASLPHSACGNCSRDGLVLFGQLEMDPATDGFRLVAHEISHMWWGRAVGFDENRSLGYEEALANYCDERLARERLGQPAFRAYLVDVLLPNARIAEAAAGVSLRDCRYETPESGRLRWAKASCVMLLLEQVMGRAAMDAALSGLMTAYSGRTAEPADVRRAFVAVGGEGVERFFDDYLDGVTPVPTDPARYGA